MMPGAFNQQATYWATSGMDGYGGRQFAAPVLIAVRWEDVTTLIISPTGEQIPSRATVYAQQAVPVGGYLAKGDYTKANLAKPSDLATAYEILAYKEIPTVLGDDSVRVAIL